MISFRASTFSGWLIGVLLLGFSVAVARSALAAGYQRVEIPATGEEPAISALVWSPCANAPSVQQIGPYVIQGSANCPISDHDLPLIVISHGQRGSLLGHHDTAIALADAGFVAVSFNHPGDNFGDDSSAERLRIFESRPRDASRVISFMIQNWSERQKLNKQAIGMFGFSRGGYTALALAGGIPSTSSSAERFCNRWWSLVYPLCRELRGKSALLHPFPDTRVRAVVVVDPLNLFDASGLHSVRIPVQLWASEQGGDGVELAHVEAIKAALAPTTDYHLAKGAGHFAYLAPCPPALEQAAPQICRDPKGFDRQAWHRTLNTAVVSFFRQQLSLPASIPAR